MTICQLARLEAGFDAAYEYVTSNAYAPTWMRHDAAFLVVMVSDEEEQSKDHMIHVQDFVDWMHYFRSSVYMASVINVDATRSVCPSPPNVHYVGDRYEEATVDAWRNSGGYLFRRLVARGYRCFRSD